MAHYDGGGLSKAVVSVLVSTPVPTRFAVTGYSSEQTTGVIEEYDDLGWVPL
jgi:hypothetical protein